MTSKEIGKKVVETGLSIIATVIGALFILSMTNSSQKSENIDKEIVRIDKEKASIRYVDEKCKETKESVEFQQKQLYLRLSNIEQTTQNIYNYLLNQKK